MAKSKKNPVTPQAEAESSVQPLAEQKSDPLKLSPVAIGLTLLFFVGWFFLYWHGADCVRVFCISSVDSFWLIQAGRDILANGRLPTGDIYSYTNFGRPWVLYQWLFEILGAGLDRLGGLQAVQAFVDFMAILIFPICLMQGLLRRGVSVWVGIVTAAFSVAGSYAFLTLRPHLISLFFVYLVNKLLGDFWRQPSRQVFWLLPLFAIWANVHMLFPLGLVMITVYWLSSLVYWGLNRQSPEKSGLYARQFRVLALVLLLCVAATFINPYGWHLYSYGWGTANAGFWKGTIGEAMAPQFDDPVGCMIAAYILFSIFGLILAGKRPTLPEALIYLGLLSAGLTSWKMLPYFVSGTMEASGVRLNDGLELISFKASKLWRQLTAGISRGMLNPFYTVALLSLGVIFGLTHKVLFPPWVPQEAADYLEKHPLPQKIFTAAKFGSYMLYRTNGRFPVFIDNRFDMYGPTFSDRYFVATGFGIGWVDIVKEYDIKSAFVESDTGIARLLWASPDWKLIYSDGRAMIFVRNKVNS